MMGTILMIGGQEVILVILVALVLFGADKIPDLARTVGKGMREFKKASDDIMAEINNSTSDIRKDISDVTDSVRKDMDKVTGSIMSQVNEVQTSVQQNIDEVSKDVNNITNPVQQNSNEVPRNFNDTSEDRINGTDYDYSAPYDYSEVPRNFNAPSEPAINEPVAGTSSSRITEETSKDTNNIADSANDAIQES
jgi:sec-independent protein translocase protein TatA